MDLVNHYSEILPPTIAKKKRDSDRPIPVKKRTAPIDLRVSRSRLSAQGIDPKQIYQQISHSRNASRTRGDSSAGLPPIPGTPPATAAAASPQPPPPPPPTAPQDPNAPPPRPMHFADPIDDEAPQDLTISPPTPRPTSPPLAPEIPSPKSPTEIPSPKSPTEDDKVIAPAGAGLSRTGSGNVVRGARPIRGPRAAGGGSVSLAATRPAHVRTGSNLSDKARSPAPHVDPHEYDPKGKKVGRAPASAFSRRTVASDTEEEVMNQGE